MAKSCAISMALCALVIVFACLDIAEAARRKERVSQRERVDLIRQRRQISNNPNYNPFGQQQNNNYPISGRNPFGFGVNQQSVYQRWRDCHNDQQCDARALDGWWNLYQFGHIASDEQLMGDYHRETQISFGFDVPFYGYRYNYSMVYPDGFIAFAWPSFITPPYSFPNPQWPEQRDHAFIAPWYQPATYQYVGNVPISKVWYRVIHRPTIENVGWIIQDQQPYQQGGAPGYQYNPSIPGRKKRQIPTGLMKGNVIDPVTLDNITRDIQDGFNGAQGFSAQMALVVTWERMAFEGASREIDVSRFEDQLKWQNTYQLIIATDQIRAFAIINYAQLNWTTSNMAGGLNGKGGKQTAMVGFNGGNGTGFWPMPYSGGRNVWMLNSFSNSMVAGRWVYRIDEEIVRGGCSNDSTGEIVLSPPWGPMVGGIRVNVSGPCLRDGDYVKVLFDQWQVDCRRANRIKALCIMPMFHKVGLMTVRMSRDGGDSYPFTGSFYVQPPQRSSPSVLLVDDVMNKKNRWAVPEAESLTLHWQAQNLTWNQGDMVDIVLYGYYEDAYKSHWNKIDYIVKSHQNSGTYQFQPTTMQRNPLIADAWKKYTFGMIEVSITNQEEAGVLWSQITPFGWYWLPVWQREYGNNWAVDMCVDWYEYDGRRQNFFMDLEPCPCKLEQAMLDLGRWFPFFQCDSDGNTDCPFNKGALHCVQSVQASGYGAAQQCCYNYQGYLMFTDDWEPTSDLTRFFQPTGPARGHFFGSPPFTRQPPRIPGFSHYTNDLMPYQMCCTYAEHCEFYYWRRQTHTCQGYRPPGAAYIYGEPHIHTFDGVEYNFPGKGYYVLLMSDDPQHKLMIQVRLEQPPETFWHQNVNATVVTGVAIRENNSDTIEIFARKQLRGWRYRTDVYVNGNPRFFDLPVWKYQQFNGISIRNPQLNMNQSSLIVMTDSGVGIRVQENYGMLDIMVTLPPSYNQSCDPTMIWTPQNSQQTQNQVYGKHWCYPTRGLLGAYDNNKINDLMKWDGTTISVPDDTYDASTTQTIYNSFASTYVVNPKDPRIGRVLFRDNHGPIYNPLLFANPNYYPTFYVNMVNPNATLVMSLEEVQAACMNSPQCEYDYLMTGQREIALTTLNNRNRFLEMQQDGTQQLISCGPLMRKPGVIKDPTNKNYLSGDIVRFSCQPDYFIHGTEVRTCVNGTWSPGWWVWCRDRDLEWALKWLTGILVSLSILFVIIVVLCCCWRRRVQTNEGRVYRTQEPIKYKPAKANEPPNVSSYSGPNSYDREPVRLVNNGNHKPQPIIHETTA